MEEYQEERPFKKTPFGAGRRNRILNDGHVGGLAHFVGTVVCETCFTKITSVLKHNKGAPLSEIMPVRLKLFPECLLARV
jgi:hypothetical protein